MDIHTGIAVAAGAVTIVGAIAAGAAWIGQRVGRLNHKMDRFRDVWDGVESQPGFKGLPGLPERVQKIEELIPLVEQVLKQVLPNGGSSLRDAVNRVELDGKRTGIDLGILTKRFDRHLDQTGPVVAELIAWRQWLQTQEKPQPPVLEAGDLPPSPQAPGNMPSAPTD